MNNEFDLAKKAQMSSLVDYAKDAIVSKTLIKKESGTVTLFAFDKGQSLSEHTAPFDAMVQIMEGEEAIIIIDGIEHNLSSGEFIIMPANIRHGVEARSQFKMLLTMIKSS